MFDVRCITCILACATFVGCNLFSAQPAIDSADVGHEDLAADAATADATGPVDLSDSSDIAADMRAASSDMSDLGDVDVDDMKDMADVVDAALDMRGEDMADPAGCEDVLALNPLMYWPLDELDASLQYPSLGVGGPLTPLGAPASGLGVHEQGVEFDGVSQALLFDHPPEWELTEGSVSFWFKTTSVRDGTQWSVMFSKDAQNYATGGHLTIRTQGDRLLSHRVQDTMTSHYTATNVGVVQLDEWHHVVGTFGPQGMSLYMDGQLRSTNPYTGGLWSPDGTIMNEEPGVIGASTHNSTPGTRNPINSWFHGAIDEVVVFDRQLSMLEVLQLFRACSP